MSQGVTNVYLGMAKGAVVATGNTFGLDKAISYYSPDPYDPGNFGSIGVFLSLNKSNLYPSNWSDIYNSNQLPSPIGIITTDQVSDTVKIGSSAKLYIPNTAKKIFHAELVWFANINEGAGVNPEATIIFTHPNPSVPNSVVSQSIGPDQFNVRYDLASDEISPLWRIYVRSADVTKAIAIGEYSYSVSGISAAIRGGIDESNTSGWCLLVAYADDTMVYNNMSIYVMCAPVSFNSGITEISIPNINTPLTDDPKGKAVLAAAEGDVKYRGDYVTFGANKNPTTRFSIGNHLKDNFFIGEISIADNDTDIGGPTIMGAPDKRGSMGNNNHDATNSILGARQGLDLTRIDISSALSRGQTSAYMDFGTNGDAYIPVAFGAQIQVNSSLLKDVDLEIADVGDSLVYTTTIVNDGSAVPWTNVWFQDDIPPGTQFIPNSVQVYYNTVLQSGFENADPQAGFALIASLSKTDNVIVKFRVNVVDLSLIKNAVVLNESNISYILTDSAGNKYNINETSNQVSTVIQHAELVVYKSNIPDTPVTCTNNIEYTIQIENTGTVNAYVDINQFYDECPFGVRFVGDVISSSNTSGYDNTSIQFNTDRSAIINPKVLTVRPKEIITILVNVTPIC